MATLSNRIALDGGADIKQQFDAIAQAGEQMFQGLKRLSETLGGLDTSGLQRARADLQQTASTAAQTSGQVQGFGSEMVSFAGKVAIGIGALVLAGGAVLSSLSKSAAESAAALTDTAGRLGLSVEAYRRLAAGADAAGFSVEGLNRFLASFDKTATQAAGSIERILPTDTVARFQLVGNSLREIAGGLAVAQQQADAFGRTAGGSIDLIQKFGETTVRIINGVSKSTFDLANSSQNLKQSAENASEALNKLGLSAQVLSKLTPEERVRALAEQLNKIPEGAAKSALAAQLFGEEWRKALEFFRNVAKTLDTANESVRKLSADEIKAGKELSDALGDLDGAFSALKNRIGDLFAPGQTLKAQWLTEMIDGVNSLLQQFLRTDAAKKSLLEGGGFDLLDKFKDFLNQVGNTGLADALGIIRGISDDLATIWTSVLVPAGKLIASTFQGIAETINAAFGTNITGRFVGIIAVIGVLTGAFSLLAAVVSPIGALLVALGLGFAALSADAAAIDGMRDAFGGVGAALSDLAGSVRSFLSGAWQELIAALQGRDADVKNAWILDLRDALRSIPEVIGIVVGAIGGLVGLIKQVTPVINSLFGTNLSAGGLALLVVIIQLAGGFALLIGVLTGIAAVSTIVVNGFALIGGALGLIGISGSAVFGPLLLALGLLAVGTETGRNVLRAMGVDIDVVGAKVRSLTRAVDDFTSRNFGGFRIFDELATAWDRFKQRVQSDGLLSAVFSRDEENWNRLVASISSGWENLKSLFTQGVPDAFNWLATAFDSAVQTITSGAQSLLSNITNALSQPIGGIFDWLSSAFDSAMQDLVAKAQAVWQQIKDIFSSIGGAFTGGGDGGDTEGFARGGYTGDGGRYQPAGIVHRGEYVQPAHVVRQPGVLYFMEILRRVGGNLDRAFANFGVGGFALGGLVDGFARRFDFDMPGFANGGLALAGVRGGGADLHPVHLHLPSGRTVSGLSAPPSVIEQLRRELAVESMASSGRQPQRGRKT